MKELVQQKSQNTNTYINNGVMKFGNKQTTHNKYAYKYKRVRDYSPEAGEQSQHCHMKMKRIQRMI